MKVLDFGLAKAIEPAAVVAERVEVADDHDAGDDPGGHDSRHGGLHGAGAGEGAAADKRSDIWAFGCVLYEMLTGRRAFAGEDVTDTLAFIITKEPDWSGLPANTPATIRKLLRRCLEKDRKRRVADSADVRLEIVEAMACRATLSQRRNRCRRHGDACGLTEVPGLIAGSAVTAMVMATIVYVSRPSAPARHACRSRHPRTPSSPRVDAQARAPAFRRMERGSHLRRETGRARFSCGCAQWIR